MFDKRWVIRINLCSHLILGNLHLKLIKQAVNNNHLFGDSLYLIVIFVCCSELLSEAYCVYPFYLFGSKSDIVMVILQVGEFLHQLTDDLTTSLVDGNDRCQFLMFLRTQFEPITFSMIQKLSDHFVLFV
jgi:hypothetical protein